MADKFEECREVLEELLLTSPDVPLCTRNSVFYLDNFVRDYLLEKGKESWLLKDVSYGWQVGNLSEGVLCSFAQSERIFDGKSGRFRVQEAYGLCSVRCFQAVSV